MATKKKAPINSRADRFYDYLIAHKKQVFHYITAALVTGVLQFLAQYFLHIGSFEGFILRFALLLPWLKWGVYRQKTDIFEALKQLMIAVMLVFIAQYAFNYLIIFFSSLLGNGGIVYYVLTAILEFIYFLIFQFIVFRVRN